MLHLGPLVHLKYELYTPRTGSVQRVADVVEVIASGLEARWPASRRRGRPGTPAEVVLRMLVLKHLYGLSYDDLEREVRANLVYRAFARISCDRVPDAKTILKIAKALGPEVIQTLHQRVVALAVAAGVAKGRRLRIDTTVVETNVHYPTDSSLLGDSVRVLTRTTARIADVVGTGRHRVRNRLRSVGRRGIEILRAARSPKTQATLQRSYRQLVAATRATIRDAETMGRRASQYLDRVDLWARGELTELRPHPANHGAASPPCRDATRLPPRTAAAILSTRSCLALAAPTARTRCC
jgi:IS5 family transposase